MAVHVFMQSAGDDQVIPGLSQKVEVLPTEAKTHQPVVYAEWLHAGAGLPTVLIYGCVSSTPWLCAWVTAHLRSFPVH